MPRFHVRDTFEITTDRKLLVMAGSIVEGEIRAGMFVHVPFHLSLDMTARIHSIEFARRPGRENVCLCFVPEPDALELWRGLKIGDETLVITEGGSVAS
jgi:hypothetical protein